jgi:hypothetical protein
MARKDDFHFPVRRALEKDGWTITHDPAVLYFRELRMKADLGAERLLAGEKDGQQIVIEVKDFDGASLASELQRMMGQMELYQWALDEQSPGRELFLAVSQAVYDELIHPVSLAFHEIVQRKQIKLLIFDETSEVILQWLKP